MAGALLIGVVVVAVLLSGCAKVPKVYRVGILIASDSLNAVVEAFKARMTELGYVEGKNIIYDMQRSNADPAEEQRIAGGTDNQVRNGGAVLSATTDAVETGELAAPLVDKILKGTPAGTIPIVSPQPHIFINYKKAQELGLTVPQGLLKQASEIIH